MEPLHLGHSASHLHSRQCGCVGRHLGRQALKRQAASKAQRSAAPGHASATGRHVADALADCTRYWSVCKTLPEGAHCCGHAVPTGVPEAPCIQMDSQMLCSEAPLQLSLLRAHNVRPLHGRTRPGNHSSGDSQHNPVRCHWCRQEPHHVRPPHGLAHAVQGLWGRPCQHEVLSCLDCADAVRARQVRGAVLLQASDDRGHKVRPKPGSTDDAVGNTMMLWATPSSVDEGYARQAPELSAQATQWWRQRTPRLGSWEVEECYDIRGGGKPGTWPLVCCNWHKQACRWYYAPKGRCSQCLLCGACWCWRPTGPLQLLEAGPGLCLCDPPLLIEGGGHELCKGLGADVALLLQLV